MLKTLIATLILTSASALPAFAEETRMQRTLSLSGHGEVRATPDIASLSLGVYTNAPTATSALEANNKAMQSVLDALKAAGIAAKDIQTSNLMVHPRYEQRPDDSGQQQAAGFDATNTVNIVMRNLDTLGKVLDQVVATGANQINGTTFGLADDQAQLDEARKDAVKDARRKAELYASATGVSIGEVISISEGGSYQPQPGPMFKARAAEASDVPIAQGEQVFAIDVNITWEIK